MVNGKYCKNINTGNIYYYLGEVITSKGIMVMYEIPTEPNIEWPLIKQLSRLDFELQFTII